MPSFAGVNHVAFSVTDLDVSQVFYTDVLGLLPVLDFGEGRVPMDTSSGFTSALIRHPDGADGRFTELTTGLDHLGLAVASRDELLAWEDRLHRDVRRSPGRSGSREVSDAEVLAMAEQMVGSDLVARP